MKSRPCVNCTHEFLSTGPGNVVCRSCKEAFAGETWGPTRPQAEDALFNLASSLADDALDAPISELQDEIRAEGKDPADVLKSMRAMVNDFAKELIRTRY